MNGGACAWGRAGGTLLVQREQSTLRDSKLRPLPSRQAEAAHAAAQRKDDTATTAGARAPPPAPPLSGPTILLCSETHEFRSAARAMVRGGDSVLEIGCSFGDTTIELVARAAAVTAIDCSQECLDRTATRVAEALAKRAKAPTKTGGCAGGRQDPDGDGVGAAATAARVPTNPGPADVAGPAAATCRVRVELIDAVRYPGQLFGLAGAERAGVVFADIGGNRASAALTPLLLAFGALRSPPVLTVIKCRELFTAAAEHALAHGGVGDNGEVPAAASLWSALKEQHGQADPGPAVAMATQTDAAGSPDSDSATRLPAPADSTAMPPSAPRADSPSVAAAGKRVSCNTTAANADGQQLNPKCTAGETRICFKYLNTGRCVRAGCGYRHLAREHPDALADHAKRSEVGWQPEDPRRRPGATVPKA